MTNQSIGRAGEDLAVTYLRKHGYKILSRNFKARYGEIDIVAIHSGTLVFVEVKTRADDSFGTPEEAVTPRKLREVIQTAQYFKSLHNGLPDLQRIDVIGIRMTGNSVTSLNHVQNVTQ